MSTQTVTWQQYAKHTNNLDCWVLVDGYLYDTTTYLAQHPGGDQILLKNSGFDATARFNAANHSSYAKSIRDARRVGQIENAPMPEGHTEKVQQIKKEYTEAKRKREEERKNKIKQQMGSKENIDGKKYFTRTEVASHNTLNDCWVIYGNKVYDVSKYHQDHPGGSAYITDLAGKEITKDFDKVDHSSNAKDTRQKLFIGYVAGSSSKSKVNVPLLAVILALVVLGLYFVSSRLL